MHLLSANLISIHTQINQLNINLQNTPAFNPVYARKDSRNYKYKCNFNSWLIFNEKDEFGGIDFFKCFHNLKGKIFTKYRKVIIKLNIESYNPVIMIQYSIYNPNNKSQAILKLTKQVKIQISSFKKGYFIHNNLILI